MKSLILFALLATVAIHSVASNVIYNAASERIVDGEAAGRFAAPHFVTFRGIGKTRPSGGACLISDRWILTAAHVVSNNPVDAIAGIIDINDFSQAQIRRIEPSDVYAHEKYILGRNPNDIAVMFVREPFVLNAYVSIIPVATSFYYGTTYVYGFGMTENFEQSDYMRFIETKIVDINVCKKQIGLTGIIRSPQNLCAYSGSVKSTCFGDSGGPYSQWNGTAWTVIGIVSWGDIICPIAETSSVIVNVSNYVSWIEGKMNIRSQ